MILTVIGSYAKALVMTTERIPKEGETLIGENYRETFGGKGSDMAIQAARLGAQVNYIGVVGNDSYGEEIIKFLKQEKVNVSGIRQSDINNTGIGFIIKSKNAENVITIDMGANKELNKEDIDRNHSMIDVSDVVLAQLEIPIDVALYALKLAKKAGKITILNPAPALNLKGIDLSYIDYITPNETEARVILGASLEQDLATEEIANQVLVTNGCKGVVITLGGDGVYVRNDENNINTLINPMRIKPVDTNGAGDCFNASFAVALGEGMNIDDAANFANVAAGLCCTKWETVPSYHKRSEVNTAVQEGGEVYEE